MSSPLLALALVVSHAPAAPLQGTQPRFERSLAGARERAASEGRLLFVALLAEDEGRSEALARTLASKALAPWLAGSVCVAGELGTRTDGRSKRTLLGLEQGDLRSVAVELCESLFPANREGVVAAPQVAWLAPDGAVLLSVPFEIEAEELAWCFARAERRAGRTPGIALPEGARAPRRLLSAELFRPLDGDRYGRGLTGAELEAELDQRRKNPFGGEAAGGWRRILFTADPRAIEFAETELSRGFLGWLTGERQTQTIDFVGAASPAEMWSAIAPSAKDDAPQVRRRTAAAFEQLGAPAALKTIRAAFAKEEDPAARHAWMRALAACGRTDKNVRKELLGLVDAKREKPLARIHALLALGHLQPTPELQSFLVESLARPDIDERLAAAFAIALARDDAQEQALTAALERAPEGREREGLELALGALRSGSLAPLEDLVRRLCGDEIPRPRIFFRSIPPPPETGDR